SILEPLKLAVLESGAEIITDTFITRIKRGKCFTVTAQNATSFQGRRLVLACGSCAYPQAGGTASGYELARQVGHSVVPPLAALSGLVLKENFSRLAGIRAQVSLNVQTAPAVQTEGEIIFTNYGINGPAALNASAVISRQLEKGPVNATINFLPHVQDVVSYFEKRMETFSHRRPKDFFAGVLHESITNLLIDFKSLRKNKSMQEQFATAVKNAFSTVGEWPVTITSLRPWTEAMAATGGVNTHEINYNTFESLRCPGLYITGELLNVDGQSGGFNLHFAWASGLLAAKHLAEEK
ncbi:MAG: aminoacetone oxidase family FAD-binding enzyme, partial [Elusimicrobiaceae bacterium]|nr:aminoacetone oxidase family FAD-binding enzyme [Elusimicrobiaceae bacterium]